MRRFELSLSFLIALTLTVVLVLILHITGHWEQEIAEITNQLEQLGVLNP